VTCHEARELFSAFVDDELDVRERSALDAHLVGCVDCRRELDRFRRTVSLVQALPPERAPAGFVDRVVTRARPAPWPVRLMRDLFVPWTKLPLEAAAILLVGGLAVWVYQQTPEQQQSVRLEQAPPKAEAPAPVEAPARVEPPTAVEEPGRASAPVESFTRGADAPATPATPAAPAAPPAPAPATPAPSGNEKKETQQAVADARARGAESQPPRVFQESREAAPSPENRGARDALEKRAAESAPAARSAARALSGPGPADVSGRLTVDDPSSGATALAEITRRVGGSVTASRADGDAHLVDLTVPRERYPDLAIEVARLGRWQAEANAAGLPETVRVRIRLTR
jgi:hypothetical protein